MSILEYSAMNPTRKQSKGAVGRVFIAVISSYLGFGLMVAVTEQILSSLTAKGTEESTSYFAADVIAQCLYLTGAGYLCAVIARSHRFAIWILTMLGLSVGGFSLDTLWKSEPHWYSVALLVTYAPCLWCGWALRGAHPQLK